MQATLEAVRRETTGKNEMRRLRAAGRIPAVVYGGDAGPLAVEIDPKALLTILRSQSGANTLIELKVDGAGGTRVIIKEHQLDPATHLLLHADFYRVAMDRAVRVMVPVAVRGEPRGVKQQGGVLDFVHRDIELECLPGDIPEGIDLDVSELMIGQGIRLRDIAQGEKWKSVSDPDMLLVHVIAPRAEEEPVAAVEAVAAAPAEPEVIRKGKVEKPEAEEA